VPLTKRGRRSRRVREGAARRGASADSASRSRREDHIGDVDDDDGAAAAAAAATRTRATATRALASTRPNGRHANQRDTMARARALLALALLALAALATVDAQYSGRDDEEKSGYTGRYSRDDRPRARSISSRYTPSRGIRYRRNLLQAVDADDDDDDDDAGLAVSEEYGKGEPSNVPRLDEEFSADVNGVETSPETREKIPSEEHRLKGEWDEPSGKCKTLLEIIQTHPDLSELAAAMADLPIVQNELGNSSVTDTFFAPTNDAIEGFTAWAGFEDMKEGLQELLGDVEWKGFLIAYHAVPDRALTRADLVKLKGGDRFLEDALQAEMPLFIVANGVLEKDGTQNETAADDVYCVGLGSRAKLVGDEIVACNGVLHMIDTVLLPFDGDDTLNEEQTERLIAAKEALEERYPDRPTLIDPFKYATEDEDAAAALEDAEEDEGEEDEEEDEEEEDEEEEDD
jgi:uncharacterized surface protein with fasciclin (FAS1) repeats